MRVIIPNIITIAEAEELIKLSKVQVTHRSLLDGGPIIDRIIRTIPFPISVSIPSYYTIHCHPSGHKPHYDGCDGPGVTNARSWCKYSATVLLSKGFEGGTFRFLTEPQVSHKEELYRSLLIYSSGPDNDPQQHSVDRHSGVARHMLIMFFKELV